MPLSGRRLLLLAALLAPFAAAAATPGASSNWAADAELDGIVDLLDPDYLRRPIAVARLPLRYAVTRIHGSGRRHVYSFEDPNCSYCRQLTRHLEEIGDVTVHTFIVTFLGENSKAKADAVWCARNPPDAWAAVMQRRRQVAAAPGCHAPTEATRKLVDMLGINLTPTIFFADGTRLNGVRPRAELQARLLAAARHPGAP